MKKILLTMLVSVVVIVGLLLLHPVQSFLLGLYLPGIPKGPEPTEKLVENASGTIYFHTSSPFDLDVILAGNADTNPTTGMGYLSMPEEAAPEHQVPAMVILPGSGGIAPGREMEYAEWLKERGIAAFVVEYYLPRGMTDDYPYVLRTSSVTEFDVITDAYSVLKLLSTSPEIDPDRIGVMGFSYGGMATRFAMDERFHRALAPKTPGFALHVDFYGPCFQNLGTRQTNGAPLLTLRGSGDNSNDLEACQQRENELRALDVSVEAHIYPGAGHSWENSVPAHLSDFPYIAGCEMTYDDKGFASIHGERITDVDADASRIDRIAARLTSGGKYEGCLHYGYVVGRNEVVRAQAYQQLAQFLSARFRLGLNAE